MIGETQFVLGDLVYSRQDLFNDGGIPELEEGALLAPAGSRGVIVKEGYVEAQPELRLYLVRFEGVDKLLGPPVGCLPEELTQELDEARGD